MKQHPSPAGAKIHKMKFPMVVEIDDNIYAVNHKAGETEQTDLLNDAKTETIANTYTQTNGYADKKAGNE